MEHENLLRRVANERPYKRMQGQAEVCLQEYSIPSLEYQLQIVLTTMMKEVHLGISYYPGAGRRVQQILLLLLDLVLDRATAFFQSKYP